MRNLKYLMFVPFLVASGLLYSQNNPPSGINFQAVALNEAGIEIAGVDANGVPIPDKAIKVRFSIITDDPGGAVQYSEEHLTNTDRHGLFTLTIGAGTTIVGKSIKDVNWHKGTKYLKVELDINNGKGYRVVSTQQLLTVPYSLYSGESLEAKKVDTARMRDSALLTGKIQKVQSNLDKHIAADQDTIPTNELQQMTITGGKISLSRGGGTIDLPDSSSTNELQALSIKGGTVSLSQGGGTVKLPDSSDSNEIQKISIKSDSLFLSKGGGAVLFSANAWGVSGNNNINATKNFIGTTNNQPLIFKINNVNAGLLDSTKMLTFFGFKSGSNNSGSKNTFIGYGAGKNNNLGERNVAIGNSALEKNSSNSEVVAIGDSALFNNGNGATKPADGQYNVAVGSGALLMNNIGNNNTAIGYKSLYANTTGYGNTSVGLWSLLNNTTAVNNTGVGLLSLSAATTGSNNTALGMYSGLYLTTGSFNLRVGTGTSYANDKFWDNSGLIGFQALNPNGNNIYRIGNSSVSSIGGQVSWSTVSDGRIKEDVKEDIPGLEFISLLRPVSYQYNIKKENEINGVKLFNDSEWKEKYDIQNKRFSGFIAQEVEAAAIKLGYKFSGIDKPSNDEGLYALRYSDFVVPIVKSIQELTALVEDLKKQNLELTKQIEELKKGR
jgi:hypothetical protein